MFISLWIFFPLGQDINYFLCEMDFKLSTFLTYSTTNQPYIEFTDWTNWKNLQDVDIYSNLGV